MQISIVVPVKDEKESLTELVSWIHSVCSSLDYEIIFVDDGSRDGSWSMIENLSRENSKISAIKLRRNYGKSAALNEGFKEAKGEVVITLDADLQDSPEEIPALYQMIHEEGYDLISGWKRKRRDPISKRWPSKIFNRVTRMVSGIHIHDFNCGLKAYRNEVVKSIEVYGEMHRYIPVLAKWAGFKKISEKEVTHHPRKYGYTKFGSWRFISGFLDLLSLVFVTRFGKRPMHLFGTLGLLSFFIGFIILFYLAVQKIAFGVGRMTDRPIFYFGLITVIVGVQLFVSGFLAELISRNGHDRNHYQVEKKI